MSASRAPLLHVVGFVLIRHNAERSAATRRDRLARRLPRDTHASPPPRALTTTAVTTAPNPATPLTAAHREGRTPLATHASQASGATDRGPQRQDMRTDPLGVLAQTLVVGAGNSSGCRPARFGSSPRPILNCGRHSRREVCDRCAVYAADRRSHRPPLRLRRGHILHPGRARGQSRSPGTRRAVSNVAHVRDLAITQPYDSRSAIADEVMTATLPCVARP
jgi:hypothetical protein